MKKFSALFAALAALAAAAGIFCAFYFKDAGPRMLEPPKEAGARVETMLEAVCQRDYDTASSLMQGTPILGMDREPADPVGSLLWNAFRDSLHFELVGPCYATEHGVAQNVKITGLDISAVMEPLRERSQTLLEERVRQAADTAEVYNEKNEYREDFVMQVLYDAADGILLEGAPSRTEEIPVELVYEGGQWFVVPDPALLNALTAGTLG